jgi:threonine dehydratase
MAIDGTTIAEACARLSHWMPVSPLVQMTPSGLWLKAENLNTVGSFKQRGALNAMLQLDDDERVRGVVAHSGGNHAQAVAYAASKLGIAATIVMPSDAPRVKLDKTRSWGAVVVEVGPASSERAQHAAALATERGLAMVEPHAGEQVAAATATILVEILEQLPSAARVFVPLGGGGLASGLAAAKEAFRPDIKLIGVEPEVAADAITSVRAGKIIALPPEQMALTAADGLRVGKLSNSAWDYIRTSFDDFVTVSEAEIVRAMCRIASEARMVSEPSGAVAVAGAFKLGIDSGDVCIVSGGNVDAAFLCNAMNTAHG